jgi:hypothetical protein
MLTLVVSLALSACAVTAGGSKPFPFQLRGSDIVVAVQVDGGGPLRFLLDTGASRSIISQSVFAGLGRPEIGRTKMLTPIGHTVRPVVGVTLQVNDRPPATVAATVMRDEELVTGGGRVDGILGQDVLSRLVYTIDYRRRVILWDWKIEADVNARLPLHFQDGRALLILPALPGLTDAFRLIPDSGADGLVLFARRGRALPALTPLDVTRLRTLAGQQVVRKVLVDSLPLGNIVLRDHQAVVLEGTPEMPLGDGLLALHEFSRVTVNGPEGYLVLER